MIKILKIVKTGVFSRKLFMILCPLSLIGCGFHPSQAASELTDISPHDQEQPSALKTNKADLDGLIKKREETTLQKLKQGPLGTKPIEELKSLARVGKATESGFLRAFSKAANDLQIIATEDLKSSSYLEYKRIWFLADDAYKAIRLKKYQPDLRLIPYLRSELQSPATRDQVALLHQIFSAELKKESQDPRALGAECSEMFKLTTLVQELKSSL